MNAAATPAVIICPIDTVSSRGGSLSPYGGPRGRVCNAWEPSCQELLVRQRPFRLSRQLPTLRMSVSLIWAANSTVSRAHLVSIQPQIFPSRLVAVFPRPLIRSPVSRSPHKQRGAPLFRRCPMHRSSVCTSVLMDSFSHQFFARMRSSSTLLRAPNPGQAYCVTYRRGMSHYTLEVAPRPTQPLSLAATKQSEATNSQQRKSGGFWNKRYLKCQLLESQVQVGHPIHRRERMKNVLG